MDRSGISRVSDRRDRPPYIERGGEQVPPHPYLLRDVTLSAFAFRVDPTRVARLCDHQLNRVTGDRFAYRPALPVAIAYFADSPSTEAADRRGATPEKELAIWVPLRADHPRRLVWFCPYIFVDNTYPLVSGREIYGFPKALGRFEIPARDEAPRRFAVEVTGWSPGGTRGPAHRFELLSVESTGRCARTSTLRAVGPFGGWGASMLARLGSAATSVSLKQIRDIEQPDRACYQAVVEAGFRVPRVHDAGRLLGRYRLHVERSSSYPIIEDLGLPRSGQIDVLAASWLYFDVESTRGRAYGRS